MLIREGLKRSAPGFNATWVGSSCSTGYDSQSGVAINGTVIDQLDPAFGNVRYRSAAIAVQAFSTVGSTEADTKFTIAVKFQHGDSSGGGDMADYYNVGALDAMAAYSPQPKIYGTTFNSTAMVSWSTGIFSGGGPANAYDIRAAKRYIRAVVTPTINDTATSTVAGKTTKRVSAIVVLSAPDDYPGSAGRGSFSTATATST